MSEIKVNSIKGVGASTAAITVNNTDGTCTANITNNLSNRNKLINGGMTVSQRNGTSTVTTTTYNIDRWQSMVDGTIGAYNFSQSTDSPNGFGNSYKVDVTTADTSLASTDAHIFRQKIEGQNLQDFAKGTSAAKQFALSFYIKTNKTGTYIAELFDDDNNRTCSKTYTVSDANWNRYTLTFPADTSGALTNDNGASLNVHFWLSAGSSFSGGSLASAWESKTDANRTVGMNVNLADSTSNEWFITGIQLEVGSVATDFEHRSFGDELARCQRYYQQYTNIMSVGYVPNNVSKSYSHGFNFPVEMRAAPTLTISNTGSTAGQYVSDGDTNRNVSSLNAHSSQTYQMEYYFNLSGDLADFRGAYAVSSTSTTHQTKYYLTAEL